MLPRRTVLGNGFLEPARPSDATLGKKNYTKKPRSSLPSPLVGHSRGEGDINYLGQRYAKFSHNTKKGTRMGEKDGRFVVLQERCSIHWCMKETRQYPQHLTCSLSKMRCLAYPWNMKLISRYFSCHRRAGRGRGRCLLLTRQVSFFSISALPSLLGMLLCGLKLSWDASNVHVLHVKRSRTFAFFSPGLVYPRNSRTRGREEGVASAACRAVTAGL